MPDETDPHWQDIVAQVDDALGDAGLTDKATREAVLDGVRQAMDGLGHSIDPPPENVEPFPGVAPPPRPAVQAARVFTSSGRGGQICVTAGERQTLLHARQPRAYRLLGQSGRLRVLADGQPLATLRAGQSIDVEAALIQVSGEDGPEARGRYVRLTPGRGQP